MIPIGIAIIHYGDEAKTERCRRSLRSNTKTECVIINNSVDNVGYGAGCNLGAFYFQECEYLCCINNDTVAAPQMLDRLYYSAKETDADITCPMVLRPKGPDVEYCGGRIGPSGAVHNKHYISSQPFETNYAYGCCMFIKRNSFFRFEERYFLYCEDLDYTLHARRLGQTIYCCPGAVLWHG